MILPSLSSCRANEMHAHPENAQSDHPSDEQKSCVSFRTKNIEFHVKILINLNIVRKNADFHV
jgi:hypothetical protein